MDIMEVQDPKSVNQGIEKLYKIKLLGLKHKFLYSLQNAPLVAYELSLQDILTEEEKQAVLQSPIRRHQKELLFDIICRKKFTDVDRIIKILEATGNDNLSWILNFVKVQILEVFPPNGVAAGTKSRQLSFKIPKDFEPNVEHARVYRTPSERKRRRRGLFTFLEEHQFGLDPENPVPSTPESNTNSFEILLHHAATDGDSDIIEELFRVKPDLSPHAIHPETGRTPLHSAMIGSSSKQALKCVNSLISKFNQQFSENERIDLEEKRKALNLFLNHKDNKGLTALHLAAEREHLEVIKHLYDYHRCNIFIRSNDGFTPLDVMYIKTPEAVIHFLKGALPTTYINEGANFTLEMDFSTVIGMENPDEKHKYPETELLAKMVFQDNDEASKMILSHVVVKTFLELKWQKMKFWLYGWIFFQALLVALYTLTIIQIFIIDCPYTLDFQFHNHIHLRSFAAVPEPTPKKTILHYLIGDVVDISLEEFIDNIFHHRPDGCVKSIPDGVLIGIFVILGCFIISKEAGEWALLNKLFFHGRRKHSSRWRNFMDGFRLYISKLENIFQLIFLLFLFVDSMVTYSYLSELHYSAAALSVVVGWSLVLMNFGKIYGLGTYIQILGKVIKIFLKIVGTYLVLIIAFSVAFSILIPTMKQFSSFPQAFSKLIIMMTGELDYGSVFYPLNATLTPVMVPVTGHIVYTGFVLLICVILINLLVGLTVYDIEGLRGKSEVILRSIQVEKLYVMESSLFLFNYFYQSLKNGLMRLFKRPKHPDSSPMVFDLFVINPTEDETMTMINDCDGLHGMVVIKSIKEIPKKLQKEIRVAAEDPDLYVKTYMRK